MSKTQFMQNSYVRCPFFTKQGKNGLSIKCEGIIGTHCTHDFENKRLMESHMDDFCLGCFEGCEFYVALMTKWEYEHDDK